MTIGIKDIGKDMKKQAFLDKTGKTQEGIDPVMRDPEKLIFQGNYELKHGNALRAIGFINHGLAIIIDLDSLLFWSPSSQILFLFLLSKS